MGGRALKRSEMRCGTRATRAARFRPGRRETALRLVRARWLDPLLRKAQAGSAPVLEAPARRAVRRERPEESPSAAAVNLCMARRGLVVQTVLRVRTMRAFAHCASRRPNI